FFLSLSVGALPSPVSEAAFDEPNALVPQPGGVEFGSTEHFGQFLYGPSLVPFELVSVLITAAMAAVVVLARKRLPLEREDAPPAVAAGPGEADPIGSTPLVAAAHATEARP